jgi:hypothetical protein
LPEKVWGGVGCPIEDSEQLSNNKKDGSTNSHLFYLKQ